MHFAIFTYAQSVCFYLPVVTKNCRIVVQKCMPLQLEGSIFSKKHLLPYAEGITFSSKWPLPHAEGNTFLPKCPFPHAEGIIFLPKCTLPHAEGIIFSPKWPLPHAEDNTFSKKCPHLHLLKVSIILMFWPFFGKVGAMVARNSSGTINQYFFNPPGYFPNGITPGTKI
ncbi:hypothetical protein [uncultured Draconibacterium sp.]|uniref:hypothetical protein n=1 Tax=uncultured Draconibacterium sp. TaxID=1573823 RepID=UPI002AA811AE|nr:hypothetical protein [uncultured Draconibacterium sp.]